MTHRRPAALALAVLPPLVMAGLPAGDDGRHPPRRPLRRPGLTSSEGPLRSPATPSSSSQPGVASAPPASLPATPSLTPATGATLVPGAHGASAAASTAPTPPPTRKPARSRQTMVVMAADPPTRLLPPASNPTEALLVDLLYDPLYRLDDALQPVPELARDLPEVSKDGLTWRIPIKADARFHDGSKVTPEDVMFSLRMAASPSCPLGRDLCAAVRRPPRGKPRARRGRGHRDPHRAPCPLPGRGPRPAAHPLRAGRHLRDRGARRRGRAPERGPPGRGR